MDGYTFDWERVSAPGWIVRYTRDGLPYGVYAPWRMPRIPNSYLDYCIFLYPSRPAAEAGEHYGGSGMLVSVAAGVAGAAPFVYAISNRHVVRDGAPVIRVNLGGSPTIVELDPLDWHEHPDVDLAAARVEIPAGSTSRPAAFGIDGNHVTVDIMKGRIGIGDDIFMVGRYISVSGLQRNTPSARFGNISMLPGEPIETRYGTQESFLVEMRSMVGYSGSAVFVHHPPWQDKYAHLGAVVMPGQARARERERMHLAGEQIVWPCYLLGIHYGQLNDEEPVISGASHEPVPTNDYVRSKASLCLIVPAWRILEMLNLAVFKEDRLATEERLRKQRRAERGISLESASRAAPAPSTKADNPQHREDFNRLLDEAVKGPKSDPKT